MNMKTMATSSFFLAAFLLLLATPAMAAHGSWKTTSTVSVITLVAASAMTPVAKKDWHGLLQAALSDGLAEGIAQIGKATVHEERPDHSNNKSFPSGHAALAFAAATTLYRRYGWEYGAPAYALATLTGAARVAARKHHWWDVVAGAAFGIGSGWLFTRPHDDKVQMIPWISGKGGGLLVQVAFGNGSSRFR